MNVMSGLEVLRQEGCQRLAGRRVGLLTNPSAVDRQLDSAYRILTATPDANVKALFAPEHGFAGAAPDGANIASTVDPHTRLPVHSLYSNSYKPAPAMLEGLDMVVVDIQDIGVRYYTYPWTVSYMLEAAGEASVDVMILDRPNPSGGTVVDGPILQPEQSSFVGRFPVPVCHGLTLGELARLVNDTWLSTPANLEVVPCQGWRREMPWEATGLPWVPPSPNMPHLSTLRHYPGACLVEGTNLSEGRGTAIPFEVIGAPWIDGLALAEHLNQQPWSGQMGVRFRPHSFQPTSSKFVGKPCDGIQVYIADNTRWQPILVWLGVLMTIRVQCPDSFQWQVEHFDRLIGSSEVRQLIEAAVRSGEPVEDVLARFQAAWEADAQTFRQQRRACLMYP